MSGGTLIQQNKDRALSEEAFYISRVGILRVIMPFKKGHCIKGDLLGLSTSLDQTVELDDVQKIKVEKS